MPKVRRPLPLLPVHSMSRLLVLLLPPDCVTSPIHCLWVAFMNSPLLANNVSSSSQSCVCVFAVSVALPKLTSGFRCFSFPIKGLSFSRLNHAKTKQDLKEVTTIIKGVGTRPLSAGVYGRSGRSHSMAAGGDVCVNGSEYNSSCGRQRRDSLEQSGRAVGAVVVATRSGGGALRPKSASAVRRPSAFNVCESKKVST